TSDLGVDESSFSHGVTPRNRRMRRRDAETSHRSVTQPSETPISAAIGVLSATTPCRLRWHDGATPGSSTEGAPPGAQPRWKESRMSNDTVARDVADELAWDPKVPSEAVAVSVDNGTVTLRGTVGSLREKLE